MDVDDLYLAGHDAPPGRYRRVDPPDGRTLVLEREERLPGSLDGRVALYVRLPESPPGFLLRTEATPGRPRPLATA